MPLSAKLSLILAHLPAWYPTAVPIFDGQLAAIAAEMEQRDPEECQVQVGGWLLGGTRWGLLIEPPAVPCSGLHRPACLFPLPCSAPPIVQSRIYNLRETKVIRDLNPGDINKLISVSGMVTRTSGIIPDQR